YSVSIEPNQVGDGTNFVFPTTVNTLQVAIPRTYVVNATNDEAVDTDGKTSLREAIIAANANVGATDIITFDNTVFNTPQVISLLGELTITDPVSIMGPGASLVTIDAQSASRVMTLDMPAAYWGGNVTLSGLTLANGKVSANGNAFGAGIQDID